MCYVVIYHRKSTGGIYWLFCYFNVNFIEVPYKIREKFTDPKYIARWTLHSEHGHAIAGNMSLELQKLPGFPSSHYPPSKDTQYPDIQVEMSFVCFWLYINELCSFFLSVLCLWVSLMLLPAVVFISFSYIVFHCMNY